ncbi:MAG: murein biosynthesis integral membrane protein MurJ [Phycisphaerales bacterium]|jgi:putative peptidoglycan lipid II flippase|nr:murein biosynthesis integral membrane protein MurJ [Phycisphaerales bacterium]
MSNDATALPAGQAAPAADAKSTSFLVHAKLVGLLTLLSRIVGLGREIVASHFIGAGLVGSAFSIAWTVPNLFRKLFGEGALSAGFIPLYAQSLKQDPSQSRQFAAAAVNLLICILIAITLIGEVVLLLLLVMVDGQRRDLVLAIKLTMVMLPYVVLICGSAFLSGVLQVHKRFGPPAFAPVVLNLCHITVVLLGAYLLGLKGKTHGEQAVALQTTLSYWLAVTVLVAGVLQVAILVPALREVGFRFIWIRNFWTAAVRKMIKLSIPVAIGTGVLQLSVLMDKGISALLMQGIGPDGNLITHFSLFGHAIRLPMELGAPARLYYAQILYQFPLGIFAIALATAIFPALSADAMEVDLNRFKRNLRQGIEASMWEGLPASIGLMLVAEPTARLLFQHGQISSHDAELIARSVMFYGAAIWAFSLQQILSRAYYALHDTVTPVVMSAITLAVNLAVELPLVWTPLGEAGMAAGTMVSFSLQAVVMLWLLNRKTNGLGLSLMIPRLLKMLLATAIMSAACIAVQHLPFYPHGHGRWALSGQLGLVIGTGAAIYLLTCHLLGIHLADELLPRRRRRSA